jgi:hypothetical protein
MREREQRDALLRRNNVERRLAELAVVRCYNLWAADHIVREEKVIMVITCLPNSERPRFHPEKSGVGGSKDLLEFF